MEIQLVRRDKFAVENWDEVHERLQKLSISVLDLVETLAQMVYMGDYRDLYIFVQDRSDPEDGFVDGPEFYLGTWDDGEKEAYGPIKWEWTAGENYIENWEDVK